MNLFVPIHQFEIRYSNILNSSAVLRDSVAPFVKFANKIGIENENSHNERISMFFDDPYYQIEVMWDRILIKVETDSYLDLIENNSIIEEPFFNLFSKITEQVSFGEIKNYLFFTVFIYPINSDLSTITENFTKKYLNKDNISKISDYSDIGISLEKKIGSSQRLLNFGPYIGKDDLLKRNISLKNPELLKKLECFGEICEYKYFEESNQITFKEYKQIFSQQDEYIKKIWN